jgi:hypothetical protein
VSIQCKREYLCLYKVRSEAGNFVMTYFNFFPMSSIAEVMKARGMRWARVVNCKNKFMPNMIGTLC